MNMELPFSTSMIAEDATDFLSACLEPNNGCSLSPRQQQEGGGVTNNNINKGSKNSRGGGVSSGGGRALSPPNVIPAIIAECNAISNLFTFENIERYLNCVALPIDPRSPNTRASTQGLTFSFSNPDSVMREDVDRRQDYSRREANELSYMVEREAVLNGGGSHRMTNNNGGGGHGSNSLFQQWQQLGQNAFASDGQTPKASNHFHWPSVLFSPPNSESGVSGRNNGGGANNNTVRDVVTPSLVSSYDNRDSIQDTDTFPTVMSSVEVPGGLWSLPSNERGPSIEYVSDGEHETRSEGGNHSMSSRSMSASLGMSYGTSHTTDGRDNSYEVHDMEKEEDEEEERRQVDPVLVMRSPTNELQHDDNKSRDDWQLEMNCQDINTAMEGFLHPTAAATDDPITAAQLAVNQWKEGGSEDDDDDESKDKYFQPDPPATGSLGMTEDDTQRESASYSNSSSSSSAKSWEKFEAIDFQLETSGGNNGNEEDSSYYPNSKEVACLSFRDSGVTDQGEKNGVIKNQALPIHHKEPIPTEPKTFANDVEANLHFDELFSSFEFSLNRHAVEESPKFSSRVTGRKSLPSPKQKSLSPLMSAAHKMKKNTSRKELREEEQQQQQQQHRDYYPSNNSSTFLEGTVMGRKLNHRPTPPTSPGSDIVTNLDIFIPPPSPPGILYMEQTPSTVVDALDGVIGRANKTLQAYEIKRKKTTPKSSSATTADAVKHMTHDLPSFKDLVPSENTTNCDLVTSGGIAQESLIDRAKNTVFQVQNTLPSFKDLVPSENATNRDLVTSGGIAQESLIDRAKKTVFQVQNTLDSLEDDSRRVDINVDEIILEEPYHKEQEPQITPKYDAGEVMHIVPRVDDDDCPDDEKIGVLSPNHNSFDSSVNWDTLNYSMSDTLSTMSTSIKCQASDVTSPKSNTSRGVSPSFHTKMKVQKHVEMSSSPVIANRPPMSPRPSAAMNCMESQQQVAITQKQELSPHTDPPMTNNSMIAYIRRKKQVISPSRPSIIENDDLPPLSPKHTNDAWDSIEKIKRRHDEEISNIRLITEDIVKVTSSPIVASADASSDEAMPKSSSNEENVNPITTKLSSGRNYTKQMKNVSATMTPRTYDTKIRVEVQSRIDAMRELHKKNMDKMRDALDDIKDGTVRNEGDQSLEVETLQNNATRLGKATKNGVGCSSLNISTPAQRHIQENSESHFEFDDALTKKGILSPRVRGLMKKNEDLEREMREIMSLSPRGGSSPRSPVPSKKSALSYYTILCSIHYPKELY
jgi:hypothetical protein